MSVPQPSMEPAGLQEPPPMGKLFRIDLPDPRFPHWVHLNSGMNGKLQTETLKVWEFWRGVPGSRTESFDSYWGLGKRVYPPPAVWACPNTCGRLPDLSSDVQSFWVYSCKGESWIYPFWTSSDPPPHRSKCLSLQKRLKVLALLRGYCLLTEYTTDWRTAKEESC